MTQQKTLRRPGRPLGTIRQHTPMSRLRLRLEPETVALMQQHAAASGMSLNSWLNFTIADIDSGGRLLDERRKRNIQLRDANQFMVAATALLHCGSMQRFMQVAKQLTRTHSQLP
jgi:uncharacterized protein (DUF1778 family)